MKLPIVQIDVVAATHVGVVGAQLLWVDRIKVWRIRWMFDFRDEGRPLLSHVRKIDALEEVVAFDFVHTLPQSLVRRCTQSSNQIRGLTRQLCLWRYVKRLFPINNLQEKLTVTNILSKAQRSILVANLLLRLQGTVGQEGRLPHQHLVEDHAYAPVVAKLRISAPLQHLGRYVVGCAH